MSKSLTDFSVLTFDCYGTLIDWEEGIWDALQPLLWRMTARQSGGMKPWRRLLRSRVNLRKRRRSCSTPTSWLKCVLALQPDST